ncbi:hypothetical protein D3C84_739090 [compost metagenome]
MTSSAARAKQLLAATGWANIRRLGIALLGTGGLPVLQAVSQLVGEDPGVFERRGFHPAPGCLVADNQAQVVVAAAAIVDPFDEQAQASTQLVDLILVTGQKTPARSDLEPGGVGLEHFRGVTERVDADRIEKHITPDPIPQQLLDLAQTCGFQRTGVAAAGEDEVDHHHLVLDQVIEKVHLLSVLIRQWCVRKIPLPPGRGVFCQHLEGPAQQCRA